MNYNLNLTSLVSTQSSTYTEMLLQDRSVLTVSLTGVSEEYFPLYLKINWGDGTEEHIENEINKNYSTDDITLEVIEGKFSSILAYPHTHEYFPSPTSLYKTLTATFTIEYVNENMTVLTVPLKIRTDDYFESVGDVTLHNTNIFPTADNKKEHQFLTKNGGYLVELRTMP